MADSENTICIKIKYILFYPHIIRKLLWIKNKENGHVDTLNKHI